jgi:hypothetical protein
VFVSHQTDVRRGKRVEPTEIHAVESVRQTLEIIAVVVVATHGILLLQALEHLKHLALLGISCLAAVHDFQQRFAVKRLGAVGMAFRPEALERAVMHIAGWTRVRCLAEFAALYESECQAVARS